MNPDLHALLRTLADVLDGLGVGVCVFDEHDCSQIWNRTFFKLFPEHEFKVYVGEPYADNLRRFYSARLSDAELPHIDAYIQAGVERHRNQTQPYQYEHRGRLIRVASAPLAGVGRVRVWSLTDHRPMEALEVQERLAGVPPEVGQTGRSILDRLPDGLMICGQDGMIQWVNEPFVRMYGLHDRASAVGATFEGLYRVSWQDAPANEQRKFEDGLKTLSENLRFSGAPFELPLPGNRFSRVITQPSQGDEAFYAHVDISEIRRQQIQLAKLNSELSTSNQQANAASNSKSQFLANMSHEIRTPMNAIVGLLELLRLTELNHEQEGYVAKSKEATRSLLTLIDDILDLSKVEAGRMSIDPQPLHTESLFQNLSVILTANVGNKPLEVLFDIEASVPSVIVADQQRLQQILVNLLANALKFTPQGHVLLRVRCQKMAEDSCVIIFTVEDTGIGIAAEHQEHIFDGFSQAEASTTRRFGGTGLGLSISQHLVKLMGGRIELTSEIGRGSSFAFALQFAIPAAVPSILPLPSAISLRPRPVLVVDDYPMAGSLTTQMVRDWGCRVNSLDAGALAVEWLRTHPVGAQSRQVLILDAGMPAMDGWETARHIRSLPGAADRENLAIVMVGTDQSAPITRTAEERALVDAFVAKPFTSSMLQAAVATAMTPPAPDRRRDPDGKKRRLVGLRILVVEDNLINQHIAEGLLGAEGALVSMAGNGRLGVDAVAAASPQFDVVLMDIQMPVMDGYAATKLIREELGLQDLPIVAMTANTMDTDRANCLAAGMDCHVGKPFKIDDLVGLLLEISKRS